MNTTAKNTIIALCCFLPWFAGCQNSDVNGEAENKTEGIISEVIEIYAEIVYLAYSDSLHKARDMTDSVEALVKEPSEEKLQAARQSWIEARLPYLQTEVFRFYGGPIDDADGPEGLLNAWPMDEAYVDYVREAPEAGIINNPQRYPEINSQTLAQWNEKDGEENVSTGYHAIEFLLWGQDFQ